MVKKLFILTTLIVLSAAMWLVGSINSDVDLHQWALTFTWLAVIYFVFKVALEGFSSKRIQDSKSRYTFRKTTSLLYLLFSVIVVLRIWVDNPQSLLVAYGLVAAGVAISLQDIFKNFVGGFTLLINNAYSVGDRIEINGSYGDVIDIGLMYTTLLEIRQWVDGDQATGRLSVIPNGKLLSESVNNYTKDHHFIWDEIQVPITYDSDWQKTEKLIKDIVTDMTQATTEAAQKGIAHISEKYYLSKRNTDPSVFISMTDNWISFQVRYVSDVRNRRLTNNELTKKILTAIQEHDDITIASETLIVTNQQQ